MRKPTPTFVVAVLALIIALGGTANAVVHAAVPLARRALVADNAKKLNGQTASQIAKSPGPASTAAGLVSIVQKDVLLSAQAAIFPIQCEPSQKIVGAWSSSRDAVFNIETYPLNAYTMRILFVNLEDLTTVTTVTLYAACIR